MRTLLPHRFKNIGWLIFIPSAVFGFYCYFSNYTPSWLNWKIFVVAADFILGKTVFLSFSNIDMGVTLFGALTIIGGLMVGFSAEKEEDEFIAAIRLSSLQWAVIVNYIVLFLFFITCFGSYFFIAMVINLYTVLLFYIIRFHTILYLNNKKR